MEPQKYLGASMSGQTRKKFLAVCMMGLSLSAVALTSCQTAAPTTTASTSAQAASKSTTRARVEEMTRVLQDGVNKNIAAGFAVALTDRYGQTEKAFVGLADRENNKPIDNDTVYRLYSMTKPVTAVAIMMLVEEGKIDLDAPLSNLIPSFANARVYVSGETLETLQTAPLVRPLTVRDLMRQTSGMPYVGREKPVEKLYFVAGIERAPGEAVPGASGRRVANLAELADRIAATPLSSQPGAIYTYGNAIDVLGRVVEVASGQSLGSFFQSRIFTPLNMTRTGFNVQAADRGRLASGYFSKSPKPITTPFLSKLALSEVPASTMTLADAGATSLFNDPARIEFGGSGLVGTLDDYVIFAQMIANKGSYRGTRILREASVAEMGRDQLSRPASVRLRKTGRTYGLGFGRVLSPTQSNSGAPAGTMFWAGAAGTYFWSNPATGESGVLMTQVFGDNLSVYQGAAIRAAHGVTGQ
jgi:CubicO group peptidase (beta-lactamase class C family)